MENIKDANPGPEEYGESTVGITEFLSAGPECRGSVKYRFMDFLVNEIDLQGNVIYPKKPQPAEEKKDLPEKGKGKPEKEKFELSEDSSAVLRSLLGSEKFEALEAFLQDLEKTLESGDKNKTFEVLIPSPEDKEKRRAIHETVKAHLSIFESETVDRDSSKLIRIYYLGKNKRRRVYTKDEGLQVEFVLFKTNFDTLSAINYIGKMLHKPVSFFGIAGTKDKRGATTQRVSVFKTSIEEISGLQRMKNWNKSIVLSDFRVVKEKLRIGSLYGNKFTLAIRFLQYPSLEDLKQNLENLQQKGFINYFGMQRFGSSNIHTHSIGLNIMKRNWRETVEMILSQEDQDALINSIKKEFLTTNNFSTFLKRMPIKFKIERSLVEGLKRNNGTTTSRPS